MLRDGDLWELDGEACLRHPGVRPGACLSADGLALAELVGREVEVLDLSDGFRRWVRAPERGVRLAAVAPRGGRLVATGPAGVAVLELASPAPSWWLVDLSPAGPVLAVAPDGARAVVSKWAAGAARVVALDGAEEPWELPGGPVAAAVFTPDGRAVLTSGYDLRLRFVDLRAREVRWTRPAGDDLVEALFIEPGGRRLVTGGLDGAVAEWDLERLSARGS